MADDSVMNREHMMTKMQTMDTNGDGKISKEEYMAKRTISRARVWCGIAQTAREETPNISC